LEQVEGVQRKFDDFQKVNRIYQPQIAAFDAVFDATFV